MLILQLDDWVLCRIYNKKGGVESKQQRSKNPETEMEAAVEDEDQKPDILTQTHYHHPPMTPPVLNDFAYFDSSESMPRLQPTDSSCSEHVISTDFTCEREVQSEPKWRTDWPPTLEIPNNNMDAIKATDYNNPFLSQLDGLQLSPVFRDPYQDILMYLQKPF